MFYVSDPILPFWERVALRIKARSDSKAGKPVTDDQNRIDNHTLRGMEEKALTSLTLEKAKATNKYKSLLVLHQEYESALKKIADGRAAAAAAAGEAARKKYEADSHCANDQLAKRKEVRASRAAAKAFSPAREKGLLDRVASIAKAAIEAGLKDYEADRHRFMDHCEASILRHYAWPAEHYLRHLARHVGYAGAYEVKDVQAMYGEVVRDVMPKMDFEKHLRSDLGQPTLEEAVERTDAAPVTSVAA